MQISRVIGFQIGRVLIGCANLERMELPGTGREAGIGRSSPEVAGIGTRYQKRIA